MNRELPKPLRWVGSSLSDLRSFPSEVRSAVGYALYAAQNGHVDPAAKPMKGFGGASVMEIIAPFAGNTWRAVYTIRFQEVVYVLHAFQKKSKSGISTPKKEIDLIYQRLAAAQRDYETRQKFYADQKKNR
ncbi:MAG: type II toxin-antitoxin system RelE/ParE family toxin [Acidobacteriia bacterium]|nr:type II toxin-antitoxin system RelE/ParE family toxin [Terriglobia bacterium]